ncbi:MAG: hypothetical protein K8F92_10245 [Hyphomicrobium sp.]|nr:MAG: hypothetical protein F9K20_08280 [Hyphomicrobium sp.]MBZ0210018.1 hypothetical protein [Hyphomicrobium sp.]
MSGDSPWLQSLKIWSLRQTRSGSVGAAQSTLAQDAIDLGDCPTQYISRLEKGLYRCDCEARALSTLDVYGSDEYSTKGKICESAVHAGVLSAEPVPGQSSPKEGEQPKLETKGGAVTFEVVDSPPVFKTKLRNGIRSQFSPTKGDTAIKFVAP